MGSSSSTPSKEEEERGEFLKKAEEALEKHQCLRDKYGTGFQGTSDLAEALEKESLEKLLEKFDHKPQGKKKSSGRRG